MQSYHLSVASWYVHFKMVSADFLHGDSRKDTEPIAIILEIFRWSERNAAVSQIFMVRPPCSSNSALADIHKRKQHILRHWATPNDDISFSLWGILTNVSTIKVLNMGHCVEFNFMQCSTKQLAVVGTPQVYNKSTIYICSLKTWWNKARTRWKKERNQVGERQDPSGRRQERREPSGRKTGKDRKSAEERQEFTGRKTGSKSGERYTEPHCEKDRNPVGTQRNTKTGKGHARRKTGSMNMAQRTVDTSSHDDMPHYCVGQPRRHVGHSAQLLPTRGGGEGADPLLWMLFAGRGVAQLTSLWGIGVIWELGQGVGDCYCRSMYSPVGGARCDFRGVAT